ncbi:TetR family transcriptional regulator [Actinophytocola xinjiangensis]|uniref:TetR family transcriptional regulator n=1 Tax=Actinophytocola xinjiangensis TaxID=485602 RepID=A0A7Z0WI20_9PSEU|nr:TetR/AcrR family transcriptional regulator [Actinophytocola xinjiangensis]OLF07696.1 TetR family transcriptional regulator [Actinophytocola xinjiangensis]
MVTKQGKPSERRDALVRIAAELFAEQGYRATTVRHIGDAAGVLSGSLYHHFDSKETILDELLSSYLDELLATYRTVVDAGHGPARTLRELVRASFRSMAGHRAAITVLQNERNHLRTLPRFGYLATTEDEVRHLWITALREGVETGEFRADLDPAIAYRFLRDSVWGSVRWIRQDGARSLDQLADQYLTLTFDGLTATGA